MASRFVELFSLKQKEIAGETVRFTTIVDAGANMQGKKRVGTVVRPKHGKRVRKDIYIDSEVWELFRKKSRGFSPSRLLETILRCVVGSFPETEKMVEESRKLRLTVTKIKNPRRLQGNSRKKE